MKQKALILSMACCSFPLYSASNNEQLQREIQRLQEQTRALQSQLNHLQKELIANNKPIKQHSVTPKNGAATVVSASAPSASQKPIATHDAPDGLTPLSPAVKSFGRKFHSSPVLVHSMDAHPESVEFYPTALVADEHIVTFIGGTPVVNAPFLGSRPAFDGSDYIVNISSINRDIRLMQQRRRMYRAFQSMGYPIPQVPIIALSGKIEPIASLSRPYVGNSKGDISLGSGELDVAASVNNKVEGYLALSYDDSPPDQFNQRVSNSNLFLNMGFINIGNLDESPLYFTAGQLFAPYGRYSSAMISSPLTMRLARVHTRPVLFGYKSQTDTGPFAAVYGYKSDSTLGNAAAGGVNVGYVFGSGDTTGEIGGSIISSLNDSTGIQDTDSAAFTTFGGFGSPTNGSEAVRKIPGVGVHGNVSFERFNLTAEWVGASRAFRSQDLSFNGKGAQPQAAQLEGGVTCMVFDKPSSFALGYQWSKDTLALNLPEHRVSGVFNISLWKDTIESLEYLHDIDFGSKQYANGASPTRLANANTVGTGKSSDALLAQIGVYF